MYYDADINMSVFTDLEYIQLGIANSYGKDKCNWSERLLWVAEHSLDELWELTKEAEEPYQMIKALHAYQDAIAGKPTGYAIGLDATCSGGQLFAIASGCHKTAKLVNLINDGIRHDMYSEITDSLGLDLPRSVVKKPCMTVFYQSEASPEKVFGDKVEEFYATLERECPGAWEVLQLCKEAQAHLASKRADSYKFTNPSGHDVLIRQRITMAYELCVKTNLDWAEDIAIVQERKEFGLKTNAKGVPNDKSVGANLAHVMDSWYANTVVDTCKEQFGFDVYHVFDKFFCSPKNMNRMRWVAREILAMLAESNYLETALREITGVPEFTYTKHSDNLADEIRKADYFIC